MQGKRAMQGTYPQARSYPCPGKPPAVAAVDCMVASSKVIVVPLMVIPACAPVAARLSATARKTIDLISSASKIDDPRFNSWPGKQVTVRQIRQGVKAYPVIQCMIPILRWAESAQPSVG